MGDGDNRDPLLDITTTESLHCKEGQYWEDWNIRKSMNEKGSASAWEDRVRATSEYINKIPLQ